MSDVVSDDASSIVDRVTFEGYVFRAIIFLAFIGLCLHLMAGSVLFSLTLALPKTPQCPRSQRYVESVVWEQEWRRKYMELVRSRSCSDSLPLFCVLMVSTCTSFATPLLQNKAWATLVSSRYWLPAQLVLFLAVFFFENCRQLYSLLWSSWSTCIMLANFRWFDRLIVCGGDALWDQRNARLDTCGRSKLGAPRERVVTRRGCS